MDDGTGAQLEKTVTRVKPQYDMTATAERFTQIRWGLPDREPTVSVYSNFGMAAKLTGEAAVVFTQIVMYALQNIEEQKRKDAEAKRQKEEPPPPPLPPSEPVAE